MLTLGIVSIGAQSLKRMSKNIAIVNLILFFDNHFDLRFLIKCIRRLLKFCEYPIDTYQLPIQNILTGIPNRFSGD